MRGAVMGRELVEGVPWWRSRRGGFVNTVVTTDPQLASYLIAQSKQLRNDAFMEQLVRVAWAAILAGPEQAGQITRSRICIVWDEEGAGAHPATPDQM
jgi:hypothetical protein